MYSLMSFDKCVPGSHDRSVDSYQSVNHFHHLKMLHLPLAMIPQNPEKPMLFVTGLPFLEVYKNAIMEYLLFVSGFLCLIYCF